MITSKNQVLKFDFMDISKEMLYEQADNSVSDSKETVLTDIEIETLIRKNIVTALKQCSGRIYGKTGAASILDVAPTTLCSRIKKYKIDPALFRQQV